MKKKSKTPFVLRLIPVVFPWIERLNPSLANRFFARLFFTPIGYPTPEKELKSDDFAKKFILTVKGMQIQSYRWGDAQKTVLVVHGWAGRATQFRRFIKPLIKEGYQVIGFDGPAHGKSSGKSTDVIEFGSVIQAFERQFNIQAIIAHSFGGAASLYALAEGVPIKTLVNIASPTIANEIINTYLKALGASVKTGEAFKEFVIRKYGKPLEEYASLAFIKRVPEDLNLLLVHDEDDKEVSLKHVYELINVFPKAQLLKTARLGHTRILRDNEVIRKVVTFIRSHSSES